ncbi:arginase family protein [Mesorhizobium amorphae]|uniref:arginase family protein n=1 Tax=Mesorhizobium amorphae TaxID=71433 RepID=UPI003ECD4D2F
MTAPPPFLGFPDRLADGRMPRAVIFGAGHGSTYPGKDSSGHALAADAIRAASQDDAALVEHGPVWILQIDAHIDWRDEVHGERYGYSSPMRRASEMPHVAGMVQVGLRSVGSARLAEIEAARHYGSRFVTAREVHAEGIEATLKHIPEGARVVVTLDCDGLDPGIMPGVAARTPGGLTYTQVIDLIAGLGKRARILGFDLVELYPPADIDGLSALTAARLLVNAIGTIVRQV